MQQFLFFSPTTSVLASDQYCHISRDLAKGNMSGTDFSLGDKRQEPHFPDSCFLLLTASEPGGIPALLSFPDFPIYFHDSPSSEPPPD